MKRIKHLIYSTLLLFCLNIQPKKPILKTKNALFAAVDPSKKIAPAPINNSIRTSIDAIDLDAPLTAETREDIKSSLEMMEKKESEEKTIDPEDIIEFYFENTELSQVLKQIEVLFNVSFITDDVIEPLAKDAKSIKGNKVSFKTNEPLARKQAWNLFTTFLDLSGFALVPEDQKDWDGKAPSFKEGHKFFRVTTLPKAIRSSEPTYIGSDPKSLPNNEQIIRYVYFVQNADLNSLKPVLDSLKSAQMTSLLLQESKAILLVDKAYNIKNLMKIITELDKVSMPQAMSVIRLYNADAQDVQKLYESLIKSEPSGPPVRFPRKQPTSTYFPEGIKVIAETRTNSLILLGPQDAIKKIEKFIREYVDVTLTQPYSPLYVYDVKYADAQNLANIMNEVTRFGANTPVGKVGGVRGGDEYLKRMNFTAEPATNQLIIKGAYEDYLKALEIIKQLDEPQPQIAVEVMVLAVDINKIKELGTQLRSKLPKGIEGLVGKQVKFQTSGFNGQGIVTKPPLSDEGPSDCDNVNGASRLLGNLITLATGLQAGNTVIQLGKDICGVWGIFHALDTLTNAQILANPFLVATNNTKAKVSVGETRRVVSSQVVADTTEQAFSDQSANLVVDITPQINSDGMIVMDIEIQLVNFVEGSTPDNTARNQREIKTSTIVSDKQILALGGLVQNRVQSNSSQVPVLGDVPVLGWLFKNKRKTESKTNLLVLISPRILPPGSDVFINQFTNEHIDKYHETVSQLTKPSEILDPVNRLFFTTNEQDTDEVIFHRRIKEMQDAEEKDLPIPTTNKRRRKRAKRKQKRVNKTTENNGKTSNKKNTQIDRFATKATTNTPQSEVHIAHAMHKKLTPNLTAKNSLTDFILAHNGAQK